MTKVVFTWGYFTLNDDLGAMKRSESRVRLIRTARREWEAIAGWGPFSSPGGKRRFGGILDEMSHVSLKHFQIPCIETENLATVHLKALAFDRVEELLICAACVVVGVLINPTITAFSQEEHHCDVQVKEVLQLSLSAEEHTKNIEYIPEQPDWTTYRDPTPTSPPPSVDEYSPGNTQSVPSVPSGGTSSSRGSKRKAPLVDVVDSHFSALRSSLDGFTDALTSSNVHLGVISNAAVEQVSTMKDRNEILRSQTEILRRTPNYTYTEADIYDMLSGMQISDETLLEQCYDFLCANPTCVKRLMGLPPHKRWNKLCKIYLGGN
ncbi:uncharacterized protein HKW66_Vig0178790 [Vigna angularis]|uniref:Uncharacterized protein n=1 Tax=Phaseolus angularis TaxID=3914 RepID=A0A8T0JY67_PHAAN|nr:uncharacterized protein HKW66_Vig0178790 [Vigna angularis]